MIGEPTTSAAVDTSAHPADADAPPLAGTGEGGVEPASPGTWLDAGGGMIVGAGADARFDVSPAVPASGDAGAMFGAESGRFAFVCSAEETDSRTFVVDTPRGRVESLKAHFALRIAEDGELELILLPDSAGTVVPLTLVNDMGPTMLTQAYQRLVVPAEGGPPVVDTVDADSVVMSFLDALSALPPQCMTHPLVQTALGERDGGEFDEDDITSLIEFETEAGTHDTSLQDAPDEVIRVTNADPSENGVSSDPLPGAPAQPEQQSAATSTGPGFTPPNTTNEQILLNPAVSQPATQPPSTPNPLVNWEPLNRSWERLGTTDTSSGTLERPIESSRGLILPTQTGGIDKGMAVITALGGSSTSAERFLGIADGTLSTLRPGDATVGSSAALRTNLTVAEGQILSFDWFYDAIDGGAFNDFAVVTVSDGKEAGIAHSLVLSTTESVGDQAASGWRTSTLDVGALFGLQPGEAIRLTLGFAAINDASEANVDDGGPSKLFVDNVRVNRPLGSEFASVDTQAGGAFETFIQRPVANDDAITVAANEVTRINGRPPVDRDGDGIPDAFSLLGNDVDPNGFDPMFIVPLAVNSTLGARVVVEGNGTIRYEPNGLFDALRAGEEVTDRFTYVVDEGKGLGVTDTATVTVIVVGVDDPPKATDDTGSTNEDSAITFTAGILGGNDIDPEGDPLAIDGIDARGAIGTVTFDGTAVLYDPTGRFDVLGVGESATDTFRYTIRDEGNATDTATVTVTITGVNDAPTAVADIGVGNEDTAFEITLAGNDTDPDQNDTLALTAIDGIPTAVGGSVTLASGAVVTVVDGSRISYDPSGAFDSLADGEVLPDADSFSYTISDGHGGTSTATVTITLSGRDDDPEVVGESLSIAADAAPVTFRFADLLSNDTDPDGDALSIDPTRIDAGGSLGRVTVVGDKIIYDPGAAFRFLGEGETAAAPDVITYAVSDGNQAGASGVDGTIRIMVTGVNDVPEANDDIANGFEDAAFTANLLGNDGDPDQHDSPRIATINGASVTVGSQITLAFGAILTVTGDGTIAYDPNGGLDFLTPGDADFGQHVETITYTITDGIAESAAATAVLTVFGVNTAPVANNARAVVDEDAIVEFPNLVFDADTGEPTSITIDDPSVPGALALVPNADPMVPPTVVYDSGGAFNALGPADVVLLSFTYTVFDAAGAFDTGHLEIEIFGTADAPSGTEVFLSGFEPGGNDDFSFGARGMSSTVESITPRNGTGIALPDILPTQLDTMMLLEATGSTRIVIERELGLRLSNNNPVAPLPNDPVDGSGSPGNPGARGSFELAITQDDVAADGSGPTLAFDWNFIGRESTGPNNVGPNDFAALTISDVPFGGTTANVITLSSVRQTGFAPSGWHTSIYDILGDFEIPADGVLRLVVGFVVVNDQDDNNPSRLAVDNIRFNGQPPSRAIQVSDSNASDGLTTFVQPPKAVADSFPATGGAIISEDVPFDITTASLTANDSPSIGTMAETLSITAVQSIAGFGRATLANGTITFDPTLDFNRLGAGETAEGRFVYTLTDANGGTSQASVTLTIHGINDAPTAIDDGIAATEDSGIAIPEGDLLANDSDVEGNALSIVGVAAIPETLGNVSLANGVVTYDPGSAFQSLAAGETAQDNFRYSVSDGNGGTDEATVTVTITGVNDAPAANDDAGQTDEDTVRQIAVAANDTDPDATDTLTIARINATSVSPGASVALASGALVVFVNGTTLAYDPLGAFAFLAANETAEDTFTYTIDDGNGGTNEATVTVTIAGVNDVPMAANDSASTNEDTPIIIDPAALLANDYDPDTSDSLSVIGFSDVDTAGNLTPNADGTLTYDPTAAFQRLGLGETATDTITYTVSDGNGGTDEATIVITVSGENDDPTANDDPDLTTDEDTAITLNVLANDTDPDINDGLTISNISGAIGTVTANADGTLTYDPNGQFEDLNAGEQAIDSFTYTISDGNGGTSAAMATVTVTGVTDTPPRVEKLVESFENGISPGNRSNAFVTTATDFVEPDGSGDTFNPTDGDFMALLRAFGSGGTQLQRFSGVSIASFKEKFQDSDGSSSSFGSALKLEQDLEVDQTFSFDWVFDAGNAFANTSPVDPFNNDFAALTVTGPGGTEFFKLTDTREVGSEGNSGERTAIYTAKSDGSYTFTFFAMNDGAAGGSSSSANSRLLVDNVRLDRAIGNGYQVVADSDPNDNFEIVMHA